MASKEFYLLKIEGKKELIQQAHEFFVPGAVIVTALWQAELLVMSVRSLFPVPELQH